MKKYNKTVLNDAKKFADERSDYSALPMRKQYFSEGDLVIVDLQYLNFSKDLYPKYSEKYMKYIDELCELHDDIEEMIKFSSGLLESEDEEINAMPECIFMNHVSIGKPMMPQCKSIKCAVGRAEDLEVILNIPEKIYECFKVVKKWDFGKKVGFKMTNPGEQMTNTFNSIVLKDVQVWYDGDYYEV